MWKEPTVLLCYASGSASNTSAALHASAICMVVNCQAVSLKDLLTHPLHPSLERQARSATRTSTLDVLTHIIARLIPH